MKDNKNNITELVFILDRSGSMSGLEADTVGGFNSMIRKQKMQDGECYVSTVLFDDESVVLHDRVCLCDVPEMTENDYTVRGCTALLDAIGDAVSTSETFTSTQGLRMCLSIPCSLSQPTVRRTQAAVTAVTRSRK